jgi:excisionase family DNA binding protein
LTKAQEELLLSEIDALKKKVKSQDARLLKLEETGNLKKLDRTSYTVAEVAEILGKCPQTIRQMIRRGELESHKLGCIRITGESLREAMKI